MAHEVFMPKLSSTMDTGTITIWLKQEGDKVAVGEAIFEVMTDKIAIEVEAYEEGILLKKYIGDGESAPVNSIIAYIGQAGEQVPETMDYGTGSGTVVETAPPTAETVEQTTDTTSIQHPEEIRATPAARRIARERGIALHLITGTGPKGRIQAQDAQDYQVPTQQTTTVSVTETPSNIIRWEGIRQVIADRMHASTSTIPHVTMNAEVDMTNVIDIRKSLLPMIEEQHGVRISYLEIITKAITIAVKEFPIFNAHALTDGIHLYDHVNVGIAVAIPNGLVVPVVKNADTMGLTQLTVATKAVAEKARNNTLMPEDMSGGTITISSLGNTKVQNFTPIINAPEVAIIGVGGMVEKWRGTTVEGVTTVSSYQSLTLSLSFDHRAVDGAPAAAFLSRIVTLLETPMGLLL